MGKYIKLEDIQNFPIQRNHCDKNNSDPAFINGIETVMEYIETLPAYELPDIEPESIGLSIEEQMFCTEWILQELAARASQYPHRGDRIANLDSYKASSLIHDILTAIGEAVTDKHQNKQQLTAEQMDKMGTQISSFFLKSLLRKGDRVKLILKNSKPQKGIVVNVDDDAVYLHQPNIDICWRGARIRYESSHIKTFEFLN